MIKNRIRRYFELPRRAARSRTATQVPPSFVPVPAQLLPNPQAGQEWYAQLYRSAYEQALRQTQLDCR